MSRRLEDVQPGDWPSLTRVLRVVSDELSPVVPQARVYNNAAISHGTSGAEQYVTFNSERYDNGGLHSTSANTSRITAPITGLYSGAACIRFASNATGYRYIAVRLNRARDLATITVPAVNGLVTVLACPFEEHLVAGDYVEVVANQSSGGALNLETGSGAPEFWVHRVAGYVNQGV